MNSRARRTRRHEKALRSCQAGCFNGLISEAIIVNTSQRKVVGAQRRSGDFVPVACRLSVEGKVSYERMNAVVAGKEETPVTRV